MALSERDEKIARYASALQLAGYEVDHETWGGPTDLRITVPNVGWLLLASGFNREDGGWEAVLTAFDESDQTPLIDGPGADADSMEIVAYVRDLAESVAVAGKVLQQFQAAQDALLTALIEWQSASQEGIGHLLDEDYPFGEALEEVVAKVGTYTERVAARLGRA